MRRALALVIALLAITAAASPVAASGKPTRELLAFPPGGFDFPAGAFCAFPLHIDVVISKEYAITFPADENGDVRQIITGMLIASFTNADTGESIVLQASGPAHSVFHVDGSSTVTFGGRSIPFQPGQMLLTAGQIVQIFAPDGSSTLRKLSGHVLLDICAALTPA
jgi:hypothetical protein